MTTNSIKMVRVIARPTTNMFVPCDSHGVPLSEPQCYDGFMELGAPMKLECENSCPCEVYSAAQDEVIFKGFEVAENGDIWNPELQAWAFVKGENRYAEIFKSVYTVLYVGIELKEGVGLINQYMPDFLGDELPDL